MYDKPEKLSMIRSVVTYVVKTMCFMINLVSKFEILILRSIANPKKTLLGIQQSEEPRNIEEILDGENITRYIRAQTSVVWTHEMKHAGGDDKEGD